MLPPSSCPSKRPSESIEQACRLPVCYTAFFLTGPAPQPARPPPAHGYRHCTSREHRDIPTRLRVGHPSQRLELRISCTHAGGVGAPPPTPRRAHLRAGLERVPGHAPLPRRLQHFLTTLDPRWPAATQPAGASPPHPAPRGPRRRSSPTPVAPAGPARQRAAAPGRFKERRKAAARPGQRR